MVEGLHLYLIMIFIPHNGINASKGGGGGGGSEMEHQDFLIKANKKKKYTFFLYQME